MHQNGVRKLSYFQIVQEALRHMARLLNMYVVSRNGTDLALDAAHVKWHAAGGPDTEDNGLALCVLHHRLFDRGALGISPDYRILVSQHVHGGAQTAQYITYLSGQSLQRPVSGAKSVSPEFVEWHADQVFRLPSRAMMES